MDHIDWNRGLLLGSLLITIGGMAVVGGRSLLNRFLAIGVLVQGIVMMLLAGGTFFSRDDIDVVSAALLLLFCLWGTWMIPSAKRSTPATTAEAPPMADESKVAR